MSRTFTPRSRLPVAASVLALTGALVLASCTGEADKAGSEGTPTPSDEASATARPPQRWPFTGVKTRQLPRHRAAVVKIENTSSSEPQVGLGKADMVAEELVEGGLTRLAAFYYSRMPTRVGPVRSFRGTDIGMVKPARAVLVASGGAPPTRRRVARAHIVTTTEGSPGYSRVGDRPAPYNLFVDLPELPKAKLNGPKPPAYLPWGPAARLGKGKPAKQVSAQFSGGVVTQWTWNGRVWHRAGSHAPAGDEFHADNVLVLRVRQVDAGYRDPAGNPVPESVLSGRGAATLFHRGRAYEGGWKKRSVTAPMRLMTAKGKPMGVPPGHTWIELVPTSGSGGDLRFGR